MLASTPVPDTRQQLLDAYPLIRSRSATEARDMVGRALSPHHLQVRTGAHGFEARHNQIRLQQTAINVLSYGAEVDIDPGERGDYYLLQLPLQGRARVRCGDQEAWVDPDVMGVLQPRARTRMVWSSDCAMVMLQVPSQTVRAAWQAEDGPLPALRQGSRKAAVRGFLECPLFSQRQMLFAGAVAGLAAHVQLCKFCIK